MTNFEYARHIREPRTGARCEAIDVRRGRGFHALNLRGQRKRMGAHRRLKFESFKKKEASDVHERLKFKFSEYGHKRLSHIQKICVLIKQSSRFPACRVKSLKMISALRSRRFQRLTGAKSQHIVDVWIIEFFPSLCCPNFV